MKINLYTAITLCMNYTRSFFFLNLNYIFPFVWFGINTSLLISTLAGKVACVHT